MSVAMIRTRAAGKFVQFCDFCGDTEDETKLLIASLNNSHICGLCVIAAMEIVDEWTEPPSEATP